MHKAATEALTPGAVLGKTIYTERGEILLARGVGLTDRYIKALTDRGLRAVYVTDGVADDVEPLGLISDLLRASVVASVRVAYLEKELKNLARAADAIIDEVLEVEADALTGMTVLQAHDEAAFEHPVEVAVYGVLLGHRIGLAAALLKDLALGCLLVDIGKQLVDRRILDKPTPLEPGEMDELRQHPKLGYEVVRRMSLASPRPAAVVLQHHERQDGTGYPNGLFGTNRISRTEQERFDARRISLLAEIAAIADVYSALASNRPYRAALPADRIFSTLDEEAGGHLNRQLVTAFVSFAQHFPIGGHVRVDGGVHDGYLGVVVRGSPRAPARPVVRLMFDASGRSLGAGREIDLRQWASEEVRLELLPESGLSLETVARKRPDCL
jgi:HD-GYP domain-containing protein (c-di-GMP phosphodiesterase class II)